MSSKLGGRDVHAASGFGGVNPFLSCIIINVRDTDIVIGI